MNTIYVYPKYPITIALSLSSLPSSLQPDMAEIMFTAVIGGAGEEGRINYVLAIVSKEIEKIK